MSNWEDEDWETSEVIPPPAAPVVGDWDDEDQELEDEEELKKPPPPAPMKPKKALELKLKAKEKEALEREREAVLQRENELAILSEAERKFRQQQIVEEADLENTKDLFGAGENDDGMKVPDEPTLETFKPQTEKDYEKFANMIGDRVRPLNDHPKRTGKYVEFLKHLFRSVTKDLDPDDTNDLSNFVGVLYNEKRDELKRSRGYKKKSNKKASVRVDRAADVRSDRYDDFADDFM